MIGKGCNISTGAQIITHSTVHRCISEGKYTTIDSADTVIEDFCFIGSNAVVMMGCRIGHHSVIGAGCVVTENTIIPPYSIVAGVPGKIVGSAKNMIPVAKPEMTEDDAQAVADTIRSGWILQGPKVEAFEKLLGNYIGAGHAVATSSCTTAMQLGFIASGIGSGDEVIVPSLSFIASANSIVHAGATPVFADIDKLTYNIDPC